MKSVSDMEHAASPTSRYRKLLNRIPLLAEVLERPLGVLGFIILICLIIVIIFAPLVAPYDYATQDIPNRLQGPSLTYWLGTDHLGRDIFSRLVYGSRTALFTAIPSVSIALVVGTILGLISGYAGGFIDDIIIVLIDSLKAFPSLFLALALLALLGPSLVNIVIVIGFTWIPQYARVIRSQVLSCKKRVYVESERSLGASDWCIISSHILPNVIAPLLILMAMDIPAVILFEAALSFLGLGVRPPIPSWGVILSSGFTYIRESPWPILWSGLALIVTTLGFTLFGETLRDVLDPRIYGTRVT
jgi:peptide/nickel transport system permease protein